MPRPALYSSSRNVRRPAGVVTDGPASRSPQGTDTAPPPGQPASNGPAPAAPSAPPTRWHRLRSRLVAPEHQTRRLWMAVLTLSALLLASVWLGQRPPPRVITQEDIDQAVEQTLEKVTLPSQATRAVDAIAPSVVRVVGYSRVRPGKGGKADGKGEAKGDSEEIERGVGTGVVIVDKGVILTNLHVVMGADRITVTFSDGSESSASITGAQPENDLAVLQAHKVPDDLVAAPLKSTDGLRPGDQVAAVGFPFGIGPSASAGIVSGLKREFTSPEGKRQLSNLIQFDAAANPGNSGGPLVTMDGEVVGIVTAILNPTSARTFLGIGFAVPIENAASAVGMSPF